MTEQLTGGIAKALDVVVKPLVSAVVFALPILYVDAATDGGAVEGKTRMPRLREE